MDGKTNRIQELDKEIEKHKVLIERYKKSSAKGCVMTYPQKIMLTTRYKIRLDELMKEKDNLLKQPSSNC